MVKIVKSLGSATIINAIATGFGSAFGIDLAIISEAKFGNCGINCSSDLGVDPTLMNLCVRKVLNYYGIAKDVSFNDLLDEFDIGTGEGIEVRTKTNLPLGSGLSSSSALSNGVVTATSALISDAFCLQPLTDLELINLAIDASLEAQVTITGAFDDASASYFGGITVTNNMERKILIQEHMPETDVLVFMPNESSLSGYSDVNRMKLLAPLVKIAFKQAIQKDFYNALTLNGLLYANALNFDNNIAIEALNAGAKSAGLSGTGSSFVAIVDDDSIDDVKDAWMQFEGNIIETKVNNDGTKFI